MRWSWVTAIVILVGCDRCEDPVRRGAVAECTAAHGEVRAHPADEWVWNGVSVGDRFNAGDWVRTGVDSRARIRFETGTELGIDPSSTVVLELPQPPKQEEPPGEPAPMVSRVKVETGQVRGVIREAVARSEVLVATPEGKTIRIRPSEPGKKFGYRVRVGETGVMELAVTEGRAEVSGDDGARVSLAEGQAHDVVAGTLVGGPIELPDFPKLTSPGVDANVVWRDGLQIALSWSEVDTVERFHLEVASDQSFTRTVLDRRLAGTDAIFAPSRPGTFYWRVASRSAAGREGEFGFARRIRVTKSKIEDLLVAPVDNALIKYTRRLPLVHFSWQAVAPPAPYRLVVARDRGLTRVVFEKVAPRQRVATRALSAGTYYWGVFAEGEPRRPLFEKPRRLRIRKDVGLRTPKKVTFE